ncbi:hypothetical protein GCM10025868_16450 [Angustibacter aerolatus]|uniref:Uncharacterized protein n=1 Tax=Angustibacter aerolatus TaxID=1162965 RepID=A0ABQ6JHT8_9ACTN|nr:hypothetical protein GCM10025868_16450 [Angustibacter aerolatus]
MLSDAGLPDAAPDDRERLTRLLALAGARGFPAQGWLQKWLHLPAWDDVPLPVMLTLLGPDDVGGDDERAVLEPAGRCRAPRRGRGPGRRAGAGRAGRRRPGDRLRRVGRRGRRGADRDAVVRLAGRGSTANPSTCGCGRRSIPAG